MKDLRKFTPALIPNHSFGTTETRIMIGSQVVILLSAWSMSRAAFLPTPVSVLRAVGELWQQGLLSELITSLVLNVEALAIATIISLALAYSTVMPFFRWPVAMVSKFRFLSLAGLTFFFTMYARNGHELKLYLLVFVVTVFYVTSMLDVVAAVPKESFDLARTLRMGEWRATYEVVVLGAADKAIDALRQNAAMSWAMLSMIEGISRSEGGVGALLLNQSKYFRLDAIFAIQITILLLGLGQDYLIGVFKNLLCPYAQMKLERR